MRLDEGVADGLTSAVALPLRAGGEPVAVVVLVSRTPREPEPASSACSRRSAATSPSSCSGREAESRVAAQAEDLKQLSSIAHELAGQSDHYAARMTLTRAVRDVTSASSVVLWEPTAAGEELEVTAATGAALQGMTVPLGVRSVLGDSFHTGDLEFVTDIANDPRIAFDWHELTAAASGAWVPVVRDGRSVGVLLVSWNDAALGAGRARQRDAAPARRRGRDHRPAHRPLRPAAVHGAHRRADRPAEPARVGRGPRARARPRRRHGGELCLAMLDLDRFKAFNDHHGHQAGDQLLAATAVAWRPALRTTDTLARYGGEEFAVLLPHSDEEGARVVVERLLEVVPLGQTASAGIAIWDGSESAGELLARADAALYAAKNAGRARALLATAQRSERTMDCRLASWTPMWCSASMPPSIAVTERRWPPATRRTGTSRTRSSAI